MRINVENFKELLKKATINFSIETVQLRFGGGKIKSNMVSSNGNSISLLDVENGIIDTNDETDFNFSEPAQGVIPYLNLFDEDMIQLHLYDNRMTLKSETQKSNISFCSPLVVNVLGTDSMKTDLEWFFEFDVDEEFKNSFTKIKKIGGRFGKVYFEVRDEVATIETCDKTNQYSNGLSFVLNEEVKSQDLVLCFDYKDIVNLMAVINSTEGFKISLTYKKDQELGMLYAKSVDESEKYFLLSKEI